MPGPGGEPGRVRAGSAAAGSLVLEPAGRGTPTASTPRSSHREGVLPGVSGSWDERVSVREESHGRPDPPQSVPPSSRPSTPKSQATHRGDAQPGSQRRAPRRAAPLGLSTSPDAQRQLGRVQVHHVVPQEAVQDVHDHRLEHHLGARASRGAALAGLGPQHRQPGPALAQPAAGRRRWLASACALPTQASGAGRGGAPRRAAPRRPAEPALLRLRRREPRAAPPPSRQPSYEGARPAGGRSRNATSGRMRRVAFAEKIRVSATRARDFARNQSGSFSRGLSANGEAPARLSRGSPNRVWRLCASVWPAWSRNRL